MRWGRRCSVAWQLWLWGGLLYATFMTLYVVPVMYDILYRRVPREVDLGDEAIDDDPGVPEAYLEALQNAQAFGRSQPGGGQRRFGNEQRDGCEP